MYQLFYGRKFPYLSTFYIDCIILHSLANIKLEKKLFAGLRTEQKLMIIYTKNVRIIDNDAFSNFIELEELHLSDLSL